MIKEALGPEDTDKVWRARQSTWLHYAHDGAAWRAYPVDPRTNPMVMSARTTAVGTDGLLRLRGGFEEVP